MTRSTNPDPNRPPWGKVAPFVAMALVLPAAAFAQIGGDYDLTWSTIDGGGGMSSAAAYRLFGTAAQPDAGRLAGGHYALAGGFGGGSQGGTVGVHDPTMAAVPAAQFALRAITPNPFTGRTSIAFDLPAPAGVELDIYSASGKLVRRLLAETRPAGRHEVVWTGTNAEDRRLARGVYLVRLSAAGKTATRKVVLSN